MFVRPGCSATTRAAVLALASLGGALVLGCADKASGQPAGAGGSGSGGLRIGSGGSGSGSGGVGSGASGGPGSGGASVGAGGTGAGGAASGGSGGGGASGAGGTRLDGGACNSVDIAPTASACKVVTSTPTPVGGTVSPGLYVQRLESDLYQCGTGVSASFRLTSTGADSFAGESWQLLATGRESRTNFTLTVSGTTMNETFTCGYTGSQSWAYSVVEDGGVPELYFIFRDLFFYTYERTGP